MNGNLSPNQFESAGFERWTRNQEKTLRAQHQAAGGGRYPTDVGRKISQLQRSRYMLEDFASMDYYTKRETGKPMGMMQQPLHELLPEHYHHLVNEYRQSR